MSSKLAPPSSRVPVSLPAATRLGPVQIAVTQLDRAVDFYSKVLAVSRVGRVAGKTARVSHLRAGDEDLVVLREEPGAKRAGRHSGLFHVAYNFSSRIELARAVRRVAQSRLAITGASDHGTHEAVYLSDPDGNGLELAWDLPREFWPSISDQFVAGPQPLDVDALVELTAHEPVQRTADSKLRVGHVHLHVGDVVKSLAFYVDLIGFDLQVNLGRAAFMSAGGYHHHLATNVWRGQDAPAVPSNTVGLRDWCIYVPTVDDVLAVRDRLERGGHVISRGDARGFSLGDPWNIPLSVAVDPRGSTDK